MEKPTLCTEHFYRVANYFDKRLAYEFERDGDNCLVCNKTINVEMARWFIRQNKTSSGARFSSQMPSSRMQA